MAQNVNKEVIELELVGFGKLSAVRDTFGKFNKSLSFTPKKLKDTIKEITKFDTRFKNANGTSERSVNIFKKQIAALKELQNNVVIGGKAYKAFGAEADRLRAKLQALTNTSKKQKFGGFGAGGVAAIGGAGAIIGSQLGIPPAISGLASAGAAASKAAGGSAIGGALAGATIGAGITAVAGGVQFARQAAQSASQVQKLEIALRGAVKTEADFQKGLEIISKTSKRLNVPIGASTKQFTTLAASVVGAGGTIEDAEEVFTGVSNSIKATGGNAEDVQSAIRAMSQIFGKGKVSAEELQGQLGERLAGAVVKFAEANGSSLQKLQKDLRDGTVGLDQVIKFAEKLNKDFATTAEKVANSSADAGERLKTQFNNFSIEIGKSIIPIGAALQGTFSDILIGIQENEEAMKILIFSFKAFGGFLLSTVVLVRTLARTLVDLGKIIFQVFVKQDFEAVGKIIQKGIDDLIINYEKDIKRFRKIQVGPEAIEGQEDDTSGVKGLPKLTEDATAKSKQIFSKYVTDIADVTKDIQNLFVNTFKKIEDSLVDFITTGTMNFRKFAQDIVREMTRIFVRGAIMKPLTKSFENIINPVKEKATKTTNKQVSFLERIGTDFGQGLNLGDIFTKKSDIPLNFSQKSPLAKDVLPNVKTVVMPNVKVDDILEKEGFNTSVLEGILDIEKGRRPETFVDPNKVGFGTKVGNFFSRFLTFPNVDNLGRYNRMNFADGGVIPKNRIVPTRYAKGGLIESPTLFPLANGAALAGEAGVEAIMPLRRGKDGRLGVETSGGVGNVTVNVDASGSSAEGDEQISTELGKVLGAAIQAELVNQKRPGGLLA